MTDREKELAMESAFACVMTALPDLHATASDFTPERAQYACVALQNALRYARSTVQEAVE